MKGPRWRRDPDGTDAQVLQALRDFAKQGKTPNEYQLLHYCSKHMYGTWSIGKIEKAVKRLEFRGRVETEKTLAGGRACLLVRLEA
ncbi:MAG: hypothetical protein A4E49_03154 [Methanosaeta sp. PtaU1.Bin112]|nr:MAG: hypothetical protein A4E49_03154 [Methanosaeta sp. PtaU1.Bin112]